MINYKLFLIDNDAPDDLIEWVGERAMRQAYEECQNIYWLYFMYNLADPILSSEFYEFKNEVFKRIVYFYYEYKFTWTENGKKLFEHYKSNVIPSHEFMDSILNCFDAKDHEKINWIMAQIHRRRFTYKRMVYSLLG